MAGTPEFQGLFVVSLETASHCSTVPSNTILVKFIQFWKAWFLIFMILFGMVISVKLVQPANAERPMLVTLSGGIVMFVKLVQFSNAEYLMLVTLSGIVMLAKLVQFLKALYPMLVTLSGIVILVKLVQP